MKVILSPSKLSGSLMAQPSKSDAHRKLICAVFAKGTSVISNVILSEDLKATLRCAKAAGATYSINEDSKTLRLNISVTGIDGKIKSYRQADCGESGSTVRFMTMIFAAAGGETILKGHGRLPMRPMDSAIEFLQYNGLLCSHPADEIYLPLKINGELISGEYEIDASVTSQYISGLLMALPAFSKHGRITAGGKYESKGYVEVTKQVVKSFGVEILGNNPYIISKNNGFTACNTIVDGDWSNASYFLVMNALGANIDILGIDTKSKQPDSIINDYIEEILNNEKPILDVSECPDIMPSLAALSAAQNKTVKIVGGKRLRAKESDRIHSVAKGLIALGVKVNEFEDGIEIFGNSRIQGGEINACNDHRIAMAFSTLCTVAENDIVIIGAESVSKSYPAFFEDINKLGGDIR